MSEYGRWLSKPESNRIKEERKALKLTQKELADEFNQFIAEHNSSVRPVSYAAISRWETGDNEPNQETWNALANLFKVTVPYLQGYNSERRTSAMDIDEGLDKVTFSPDPDSDAAIRAVLKDSFEDLSGQIDDLQEQVDHLEHRLANPGDDYDPN